MGRCGGRGLGLWLVVMLLALGLAAEERHVEVQFGGPGAADTTGAEIVVRGEETAAEAHYPFQDGIQVRAGSEATTVTCQGEFVWCPEVPATGDVVVLPVLPAVTVTGSVRVAGAAVVPETGTVQGVVAAGDGVARKEARSFELRQPLVVQEGRFAFTAPRALLDLRFTFPGAAPIYRWGVEASAPPPEPAEPAAPADSHSASAPPSEPAEPATLDLGVLSLQTGASLAGWVQRQEDDLPVEGAEIAAVPLSGTDRDLPLQASTARSDRRGFFQVAGLDPGTYRIEISAEGRALRVVEDVEVEAASETRVGSIALTAPLRLSVQVSPPLHPDGPPWRLLLLPTRRLPDEQPIQTEVGEDGTAVVEGLRPTEYRVMVQTATGENLHVESHQVLGGEWLSLEVPVVSVAGTVRLGDEPVPAQVRIQGGAGDRVELEAGEDGELRGWMRRPERPWLMATVTWKEGEETRQRTLEVVPTIDDDLVVLEIDLPAGAVHGEVVDGEGRTRRGVRVIATPAEAASHFVEIRTETDSSGRFHFTGLDPIRYRLQAGGNGGPASDVVEVDLADDLPAGEVRLVLRAVRTVAVKVTADGRALPGAQIALHGIGPVPVSLDSSTDGAGRVSWQVPEAVDRAVVTVVAPSHLLWSGCVRLDGEVLDLALPPGPAGTATLTLSGRTDLPPLLGGRTVLLTADGGFVPYGTLVEWNRLRSAPRTLETDGPRGVETLTLPALAPGTYALTDTGLPDALLATQTCTAPRPDLDWIPLPPGGHAALSLDGTEKQQERLEELAGGR